MTKNTITTFIVGGIVGASVALWGFQFLDSRLTDNTTPKLAGQSVPDKVFQIDFNKRYNLVLDTYRELITYTNCVIRGFTQQSPSAISRNSYFDTWLVIELSENRLAYIQPGNIRIIEEAEQSVQQSVPECLLRGK